jgi:phosphoribosylformimino-5-aminoimidazole carboxamide ribotide isomerase
MASTFDLLPAIDLRGGFVVRLEQGDFARETRFGRDPVAVARGFREGGAGWLHVVDLDGARTGTPRHRGVIRAIVEAMGQGTAVEVAGGLRAPDAIQAALDDGAVRVVVGTAAVEDPSFAGEMVGRFGADRVVVAIDVRQGRAIGEGWRAGAPGPDVDDLIDRLGVAGVRRFEVTAIERDGMAAGPDLGLLERLVRPGISVIASGGVRSASDLLAIRALGCAGAILGRALYDGSLAMEDALAAVTDRPMAG